MPDHLMQLVQALSDGKTPKYVHSGKSASQSQQFTKFSGPMTREIICKTESESPRRIAINKQPCRDLVQALVHGMYRYYDELEATQKAMVFESLHGLVRDKHEYKLENRSWADLSHFYYVFNQQIHWEAFFAIIEQWDSFFAILELLLDKIVKLQRTLYVTGFPLGTGVDVLKQVIGRHGLVVKARVTKRGVGSAGHKKVSALVEFRTKEDSEYLLDLCTHGLVEIQTSQLKATQSKRGLADKRVSHPRGKRGGKHNKTRVSCTSC